MLESPAFFGALVLLGAILVLTPTRDLRWRAGAVAAISSVAIAGLMDLTSVQLVLLASLAVYVPTAVVWLARSARARQRRPFALLAVPVLLLWAAAKSGAGLGVSTLQALQFVGFSFLLVKSWTVMRDAADGRLVDAQWPMVVAYLLYFPCFIAGPMHYYGEFRATLSKEAKPSARASVDTVFRLLWGYAKLRVIGPLFQPASLTALVDVAQPTARQLVIGALAYSFVIYLNFSGYTDVVVSASRLIGIDVPENFRLPYLARNPREFWQRWHITFTRSLTSYVFVPVSRLVGSVSNGNRSALLVLATLVTFLFCGYWHGPTLGFVLWGLYHGLGLIVYDLWIRRQAPRLVAPADVRASQLTIARLRDAAAILVTFVFVSLGWIPFVLPAGTLSHALGFHHG